jgi:hypothetical protein
MNNYNTRDINKVAPGGNHGGEKKVNDNTAWRGIIADKDNSNTENTDKDNTVKKKSDNNLLRQEKSNNLKEKFEKSNNSKNKTTHSRRNIFSMFHDASSILPKLRRGSVLDYLRVDAKTQNRWGIITNLTQNSSEF